MKITNDDQLSRAALIKPLLSLQFLALLYNQVDLAKVLPHKSKAKGSKSLIISYGNELAAAETTPKEAI